MILRNKLLVLSSVLILAASSAAFAQTAEPATAPIPGHPRVNEINRRLDNQEKHIDAAAASGAITPDQARRDKARDERIEKRAHAMEAKNGGHLTKREQHHLNHALNKTNHIEHHQKRRDQKQAQ